MDASKAVLASVAGISPLSAREIVYNAFSRTNIRCGDLTDSGKNKILYETVRLSKAVNEGRFEPCMIVEKKTGKLMDFSAVNIRQYEDIAEIIPFDSISALLDEFFTKRDMRERMRQKSAGLTKLLNNNIERISKKLVILSKTLND